MTPAELAAAVLDAARSEITARGLDPAALPATTSVERPRNPEHGDYASTLALQLGKKVGVMPRELAAVLAARLGGMPGIAASRSPVPASSTSCSTRPPPVSSPASWSGPAGGTGAATPLAGQHLNLEFVSANPTGPLHIGGARWAAVGDASAGCLRAAGAEVGPRVLLQRRRRARSTGSPVAAGRGEGRADAGGRVRRRLHRRHRPGVLAERPGRARAAPTGRRRSSGPRASR